MRRLPPLPIDEHLPVLLEALRKGPFAVVQAEPGAGKTTRIPPALERALQPADSSRQQVIIAEPRRLAARLAAHRVAEELEGRLGDRVGYSVKFEHRCSSSTTIRYVTEGVLLKELLEKPALAGVKAVILDEFHERHLEGDQLLALLRARCRKITDLKLVVMSATLQGQRLSDYLDGAPQIQSVGRSFPLQITYDTSGTGRRLESQVASAIRTTLETSSEGHILAFLPGLAEIRKTKELLESTPLDDSVRVLPLHGQLPLQEQALAVEPSHYRKIVLATNVAESSVTVSGVRAVVDTGLERRASDSKWTGERHLQIQPISQDAAIQRAGRAGRTGPGHVIRLFSEGDFTRRPDTTPPEIVRLELSRLTLAMLSSGESPSAMHWLDAPPPQALTAAKHLLNQLGALDDSGRVTERGHQIQKLSVPPRLAAVLLECRRQARADEGALATALMSERDINIARGPHHDADPTNGPSDLQDRLDRYRHAAASKFASHALRRLALDRRRVADVERTCRKLAQSLRSPSKRQKPATHHARADVANDEATEQIIRRALLAGFADRVAKRKKPGSSEFTLCSGQTGILSPLSVVRDAPFIVILDAEERTFERGRSVLQIRQASAIDTEWLFDDCNQNIEGVDRVIYNASKQRVEELSQLTYGSIVLEESRLSAKPGEAAGALLFDAAQQQRAGLLGKSGGIETLLERMRWYVRASGNPDWPEPPVGHDAILKRACQTRTNLEELRELDWEALALEPLSYAQRRELDKHAPTHIVLPCERRLQVHYEPGKSPWVASRIQDFFGMKEGPTIGQTRLPLVLHLLAPNKRASQVTADLSGFWSRHYAEVRKELRRRYAKHYWPEDGSSAVPPVGTGRRTRQASS